MPKLNLQRIKDILAKKQMMEMEEDIMEDEEENDDDLKNVMGKRYAGKNPERKKEFDAAKKKVALMIIKNSRKNAGQ